MRIATTQYQSAMNRSLQANQSAMARLDEQMSSMKKILVPSDDPVTNVRISRLYREEAQISQYAENIGAVKIRLSKNETYLQGMVEDLGQIRDTMVWALDASNTPADLNAMVNSLTSLRESLLYNSNTKDQEGRYIFSGTTTGTAALGFDPDAAAGSRYTYTGNTGEQKVVIGNGVIQTANANLDGMQTFLNQLDIAIEALKSPTLTVGDPDLRAALTATLDGVDTSTAMLSGKIADFGGAQNIMQTLSNNLSNVSLSNKVAITELGQVDMAMAASELTGYTVALQSTYKTYAKVSSLSLFNIL